MLIRIILFMAAFTLAANITTAQDRQSAKGKKIITASFAVEGVCGMCKDRIETACMYQRGVKMADWDKETGILSVTYHRKRTDLDQIHQAVAAAGHATDMVPPADSVYQSLPGCCQYRDGVKKH